MTTRTADDLLRDVNNGGVLSDFEVIQVLSSLEDRVSALERELFARKQSKPSRWVATTTRFKGITGPVAIIDTETTGLYAGSNEVYQVCALRIEPNGEETRFESYINILAPDNTNFGEGPGKHAVAVALREAMEDIQSAPYMDIVGPKLLQLLEGVQYIVGHNVGYDEMMLNACLYRFGVEQRIPYRKLDTKVLAAYLLRDEGLRSFSLGPLCDYYGLDREGEHTATKDVDNTATIFERLWNHGGAK